MNEAIRVKMAEAEGWTYEEDTTGRFSITIAVSPEGVKYWKQGAPAYDNDNDLDRFIRGMTDNEVMAYHARLAVLFLGTPLGSEHRATVDQKAETIIKAMGWETE